MRKFIVLFLTLFLSINAKAQFTPQQDAYGFNANALRNPGAESGLAGWDYTGSGDFLLNTTLKASGKNSFVIEGAAQNDEVCTELTTIPTWIAKKYGLCDASFLFSGGASSNPDISYAVKNSSNVIVTNNAAWLSSTVDVGNTDFARSADLSFSCSAGAQYKLCVRSDSVSTQDIYLDNAYVGGSLNIGDAAQATLYGSMTMAPAANCATIATVGSGSWTAVAQDTDCATPSATGNVSVAASNPKRPAIQLANAPAGQYVIRLRGAFGVSSGANGCAFRLSDGTNTTSPVVTFSSSANLLPELSGTFNYTSGGTRNIELQYAGDGATMDCRWYASQQTGLQIEVTRFPTASEQVFRVGQAGLQPTNYTPSVIGSSNGVAWTNISSNTGYYACNGQNLIVAVNTVFSGAPGGGTGSFLWKLPTNFEIDTTKAPSAYNVGAARLFDSGTANFNGIVVVSTAQGGGLVVTSDNQGGDQGPTGKFTIANGDFITFTAIVPVTASSPCPRTPMLLLSQAVTTDSSGVERFIRAKVAGNCASSPCTIVNSQGVSSITRGGTGTYTVNFSPSFSSQPSCFCTLPDGNTAYFCRGFTAETTSSWTFYTGYTNNTSGGLVTADSGFNIMCMGPR